jgi:hypothetical protein
MPFRLLGCTHRRLSFPIVTHEPAPPTPPPDLELAGTPPAHVTCLDCGREFWYDWTRMRRLAPRRPARATKPPTQAA